MFKLLKDYRFWLHGRWPAGAVEKLPEVREDFTTNVPGIYVVGDLSGVPLLKMSSDSGTRAVRHLAAEKSFVNRSQSSAPDGSAVHDVVIIGGGVSGFAAALEAKLLKLDFLLLEASEPFSTIANFPKAKPIYTYPSDMVPAGKIQFEAKVKEPLLDELIAQTQGIPVTKARAERVTKQSGLLRIELSEGKTLWAHRVVVAIGRSGNYRKLDVPGEDSGKVYNRLHDPKEFEGKQVLVVGGGDSALEAAIAISEQGGQVTLSYRKAEFSRPKPDNSERIQQLQDKAPGSGSLKLMMASQVVAIEPEQVQIKARDGQVQNIANDVVFSLIGREAPLDFFRRSGVHISGESRPKAVVGLVLFTLFVIALYDWKNYVFLNALWSKIAFPYNVDHLIAGLGSWWQAQVSDRTSLISTVAISMKSRSFYYTLLYTSAIGLFGIQRIMRRRTPYVTLQTICLFLIQLFPLFLLPEIILPYLDYNGFFQTGIMRTIADNLFELYISTSDYAAGQWGSGHSRAFGRAYGFILAWPLNVYNVNTASPLPWWLVIGFIQTFVLIPLLVYRWGKGAYCSWICSCGGLAETMGDAHRHKMPHGPFWNKLNMIGQAFLVFAAGLFLLRVLTWSYPTHWLGGGIIASIGQNFSLLLEGKNSHGVFVNPLSYNWIVDILWGGIIGMAFYFKYSGRVWCRFACPLAALMHIYARFSSFRILSEKKKCISCNVCTSVCHQGIDVMNFANKGLPMEDPQCVRCSACVESCPTGVLQFGRIDRETGAIIGVDQLSASRVRSLEV